MRGQQPTQPSPSFRAYRPGLPEVPIRMRHLPVDKRGFPIPWFVHIDADGVPDFRVIKPNAIATAWNGKSCWLCGGPMGVFKVCVVGPMCGVNRVTSEPPSHLECAEFAVKACPFITKPLAVRNERGLPEDRHVPGHMIARNPGVSLLWTTRTMKPFKIAQSHGGGVLFQLGDPVNWSFWREGRRATREEIDESVRTGLPELEKQAAKDGPNGIAELKRMIIRFEGMLPTTPLP